jgi:pimeloyl-ACP methyl ester carboxylesterase
MAGPLRWPGRLPARQLSALVLSAAASNPWDTGLGTYYTVLSHPLGQRFLIPLLTAWVPDRVVDQQIDAVFVPQTAPEGYHAHIGAGLTLRRVSMRANALHRRNLLREITAQAPRYGEIDVPVEILHGDADLTVPARRPFRTAVAADARRTLTRAAGRGPHAPPRRSRRGGGRHRPRRITRRDRPLSAHDCARARCA